MIPPAHRGGCRRSVKLHEVLAANFYVLSTGCQWTALPKDLPPKSTARNYIEGALQRLHHPLSVLARKRAGRS
jgi:transposase